MPTIVQARDLALRLLPIFLRLWTLTDLNYKRARNDAAMSKGVLSLRNCPQKQARERD